MDDQKRLPSPGEQGASVAVPLTSFLASPAACGVNKWWWPRPPGSGGTISAAAGNGSAGAGDSSVFRHPNATAYLTTSRPTSEGEAMPILRLEGTWCTNTVAHGSDLLRHWVASVEATELAVDLSEIDFCDGRAISMLLELRLIAARRGCLLRLCRPNHCVTRLFTICDLDNLLEDDFPIVQASRHHQDLRRNVR